MPYSTAHQQKSNILIALDLQIDCVLKQCDISLWAEQLKDHYFIEVSSPLPKFSKDKENINQVKHIENYWYPFSNGMTTILGNLIP